MLAGAQESQKQQAKPILRVKYLTDARTHMSQVVGFSLLVEEQDMDD